MASAFGWTSAWETYDDPEMSDVNYYDLPFGDHRRLHEGDQFWDTDERFLIEVDSVMTKVYRGVVGPQGEIADDNVFFNSDWSRPVSRTNPHRREVIQEQKKPDFISVDEFAERIENGRYVPHRGNGPPRPP